MFRLLPEIPDDRDEVEMLLDLAFAPGRGALSSYSLRRDEAPVTALCRVARDEYEALAGAIRYWPVRIGGQDGDGAPALLLGPIAVHPTRQGEGLGAALIGDTLERAREAGWTRIMLIGDAPYYARFGFVPAPPGITFPQPVNPARFLVTALSDGAFDGISGKVRRWSSHE